MNSDDFLNDYAVRCFRDTADTEYILARIAHRLEFFGQYHWHGLHAIEKYIKSILLFNRISSKEMKHDLNCGLKLLQNLPFFHINKTTETIIEHLNTYGHNRYLTFSYYEPDYYSLGHFDFAIWDIRKFCRQLNIEFNNDKSNQSITHMVGIIENSSEQNTKEVYIAGGVLEKILATKNDPSRQHLIWQNPFFSSRKRKFVSQKLAFSAVNSPLTLHPEFLEEVEKYVHLSKKEKVLYLKERNRRGIC